MGATQPKLHVVAAGDDEYGSNSETVVTTGSSDAEKLLKSHIQRLFAQAYQSLGAEDIETVSRYAFPPYALPVSWRRLSAIGDVWESAQRAGKVGQRLLRPAPPGDDREASLATLQGFLTALFADCVQALDGADSWRASTTRRLVNRFVESLRSDRSTLIWWLPVDRLDVDGFWSPLRLEGGWILDKPDIQTRGPLVQPVYPNFAFFHEVTSPPHFFLRTADTGSPFGGADEDLVLARASTCTTAIRLARGGFAQARQAIAIRTAGDARFGPRRLGVHSVQTKGYWPAGTTLRPSDVRQLNRLIRSLPKAEKHHPIALHRFRVTAERTSPEDRALDAVIGLENLLLLGEKQELRFKFALRGAYVLGRNDSARKTWFDQLQALYDLRSALAHGSSGKLKPPELQLMSRATDVLGAILQIAVLRNETRTQWESRIRKIPFLRA